MDGSQKIFCSKISSLYGQTRYSPINIYVLVCTVTLRFPTTIFLTKEYARFCLKTGAPKQCNYIYIARLTTIPVVTIPNIEAKQYECM